MKSISQVRDFYIVTDGIFEGYEGYLTKVAGANMLKNPQPSDGDWTYILVTMDQVEFICTAFIGEPQ